MPVEIAPSEAHYLKALSHATHCALHAREADGLIGGLLDSACRPGCAGAALLILRFTHGARAWTKCAPGAAVKSQNFSLEALELLPRPGASPEPRPVEPTLFEFPFGLSLRPGGRALETRVRSREGTGASLVLFYPDREGADAGQRHLASGLADLLSLGQEQLRLRRRMEAVATRDDLTSAFNFRFLKGALRKELARSQRSREPLSVIMLDVDRLKEYNDRFGHIMGSTLLQELARVLAAGVRESDWVAKYGGDEFLIILPGTDKQAATRVGERLREDVRGHTFERASAGEVTASFGVASFPSDGSRPRELIQAADLALYRAKHEGRDRLCVAGA